MNDTTSDDFLRLKRIASLKEVQQLTGLSRDTIKHNYRDKLIQLSPRRIGMRIEDALQLGGKRTAA
jgi:predicted DNA-binding transcriptional regulator AlpA